MVKRNRLFCEWRVPGAKRNYVSCSQTESIIEISQQGILTPWDGNADSDDDDGVVDDENAHNYQPWSVSYILGLC